MLDKAILFLIIGAISLVGNWIGYQTPPQDALIGMLLIVAVTIIGWLVAGICPIKMPVVIWVSLLTLLISSPVFPMNAWIVDTTNKVNFMSLATPILCYAGLSFGKDYVEFKKLGWRIVVVSLVVYTGTFLISTTFAEVMFRLTGAIQ